MNPIFTSLHRMVILGLLAHEKLTGYDIKKRIDGAIGFFWKGSFGSIYPSLAAMESDKLIKSKTELKDGREKITYAITKKGLKHLNECLENEKATNDLKYETILKIFFGGSADPKTSIKNIEIFEEDIRRDLATLKVYKENLSNNLDNTDHIYYALTVQFGITTYEAYLKWCKEAKKTLFNVVN